MRIGQNISIRTKLASLVALNVVVLGALAVYTVQQVRLVRRELREIAEADVPLANALATLSRDQREMDARLERALSLAGLRPAANDGGASLAAARAELVAVEDAEYGDLRAGLEAARQALASATAPEAREEFGKVVTSLERASGQFARHRNHVASALDLAAAHRAAEARAMLPSLERDERSLDQLTTAVADEVESFTSANALRAEAHENEVVRHVTAAGAGGAAAGLLLGGLYAGNIIRRLRTAVGVANRLALGERNFDVPVEGRDEARDLLKAMREMAGKVARTEASLQHEQQRSERLLLNVLPRPIAERLKQSNQPIADGFASVTVLFADVVGFTALSERLPPADLVRVLNDLFSRFDHLAERFGLEKIKTIGDCYMAVAGIPTPRGDHARAVAEMALAMQQTLATFDPGVTDAPPLRIRIGINSGPVVAGVIGIRKFIYDLWGDTVNVASRMESHGIAGQIQVSESTHALLRNDFVFEPRGSIPIKGKGEMNVFLLKRPRMPLPARVAA
jgi:class 3 adenylate cyclase